MRTVEIDDGLSTDDARDLLGTDDPNGLGAAAREVADDVSGGSVYYGSLSEPEDVSEASHDEVLLSRMSEVDTREVDAFVGEPDDDIEDYRRAHSDGVPTDVAVEYGDGADLVDALAEVRGLYEGMVRCVSLHPVGRTTAYTDLKSVAVARLFLDVPLLRVARDETGDKLEQTALGYGTNDLGFTDYEGEGEDGSHDPTLIAEEAGYTPVRRSEGIPSVGDEAGRGPR